MKIYFVRHGQRGFYYNYDTLIPEGIWQSIKVGKYFRDKKVEIIYCSPQKRAKQTLSFMDIKKKPIITQRLRQQAVPGEVDKAIQLLKKRDTPQQLTKRVRSFLDFLKRKHKNKNILCVTHKMFIKEVANQIIGKDKEVPSASITYLELNDNGLVKSFFGKVVYPMKDKNILKNSYHKTLKVLGEKIAKVNEKLAMGVAKKGGSKKDIAKAYLKGV